MIDKRIFDKNIELISGDRPVAEKQLDFYDFARRTINSDTDTSKLTVFSARCGLGKSTFLAGLIISWLECNPETGLIIVTDNIERLQRLNITNDGRVACITAANKRTEIAKSYKCPVLLMSTQRYFQLDDIDMFTRYYYKGEPCKRTTVIFDEAPYFYMNGEIRIDELDSLHTALNEGITDLYNETDKTWAVEEYDKFRDKLIEVINELETKREKTTYIFWQPEINSITSDDCRFSKIITDNMDAMMEKYPNTKRIINMLFTFIENGGIYKCLKLRSGANNYSKGFIVSQSLRDKFNLDSDIKTFVFDATAKISEMYPYGSDWITMFDCDEFETDMSYMTIHLYDINTSRNAIINKSDKTLKLNTIKDYISELHLDLSDTLLISYKPLIDDGVFSDIGFTDENTLYFGNVKGKNEHKDKHNMIQIGLNRQTDINYILTLLANNHDFDMAMKNDIIGAEESIDAFDRLMKSNLAADYMNCELMADLVQNVYRIKARDITNTDEIHIYLFCQKTDSFMQELQYAFLRHGAKLIDGNLGDALIQKAMTRKSKNITSTQKVILWLEKQPQGTVFKLSDLLKDTKLSTNQFKAMKRNNPKMKDLFDGMKTDKKGYYLV